MNMYKSVRLMHLDRRDMVNYIKPRNIHAKPILIMYEGITLLVKSGVSDKV